MGVAGCGKTVVGEALAGMLQAVFIEGDRLHPPENVARMARGEPLTDALREGWLNTIGERIAASVHDGQKAVAACSALKRSYRDRLRRFSPDIVFVYLKIDRETAWRRVAGRKGHFMPASLVDSQFATLEEPGLDEQAVTVDATRSIADIARKLLG
ncbi:gluconokinase [Mesorhizobium sp. M3A.F.Ca.ET.174.01.1.1]|nr:gluconokinase [Mesorhizobium sp. M3A.F.Ca.ET.080.04.2.1]PBB84441.1 gluconate kinase [Mesorhizobium sp. WSM3876]RWB75070.1 MAG: gluconokinase [Mesorhizobium sp.]TGS67750.1 gluconokinase [Mesorhizobium sp. M3A.F.Ca.ET.201.01.1.1]TGS86786.1 gluconokinase [Mesorhizobium sp. M3A.F.Ca.ET.175.01.1.1]TGT25235.1 gluconokinase [Mesorhizobium sp. M3A.F.Ca.ET.174.01.1.1]TGT58886.1 gluconokinase [Mesorhizobium sp. M00.F.Ca.ET.170.01.1.1]